MTTEDVVANEVSTSMDAFARIRAFFYTVSFVTIHEPNFFSYQDALFAEGRVFSLLQVTVDRRRWATIDPRLPPAVAGPRRGI